MRLLLQGQLYAQDWTYTHFSAQLQAVIYSLRLLKQVLGVASALNIVSEEDVAVADLRSCLTQMPTLCALFPGKTVDFSGVDGLVEGLLDTLGVRSEETFMESGEVKKKKKGKKKRKAAERGGGEGEGEAGDGKQAKLLQRGGNMYALLDGL